MQHTTTVVVPKKEKKFTLKGERSSIMRNNARMFLVSWDTMKEIQPSMRRNAFDSLKPEFINAGVVNEIDHDRFFVNFYGEKNHKQVLWLKTLEAEKKNIDNIKLDLLYCSDREIHDILQRIVVENDSVRSIQYVKQLLGNIHRAFFNIGRERRWADREVIEDPETERPVINAGNPLSDGTCAAILRDFRQKNKQAGRFVVQVKPDRLKEKKKLDTIISANIKKEDGYESDGESDDGDENATETVLRKHGLCASVALVYYLVMGLFAELLQDMTIKNDTRRLVNAANLILMYIISIHEGGRPGDDARMTNHDCFTFSLGESFNLLTLAFAKPETVKYLMENGKLKRFVKKLWKGKKERTYRSTYASWFPAAYGTLCLANMYIILMRIIIALDDNSLKHKAFKPKLNISALRQRKNKKFGIYGLTFYSIRYAAAEEDCKFNIPSWWIKWRMGHSMKSWVRVRYANNLDQRVLINNVQSMLGCDVMNAPTDDTIPLNCQPIKSGIIHKVSDTHDVPPHIMSELRSIKHALKKFFSEGKSIDSYPALAQGVSNDIPGLLADLKKIPLGSHFGFSDGMLQLDQEVKLTRFQNIIHEFFAKTEKPDIIPTFWSYSQVMYGELNEDMKPQAAKGFDALKAEEALNQVRALLVASEGKSVMPQKSLQEMFSHKDPYEGNEAHQEPLVQPTFATFTSDSVPQLDVDTEMDERDEVGPAGKSRKRKRTGQGRRQTNKLQRVIKKSIKKKCKPNKKVIVQSDVSDDQSDDDFNGWNMKMVELTDVIVVLCGAKKSDAAFTLPGTQHRVWLCKVAEILNSSRSNGIVRGQFFKPGTIYRPIPTERIQKMHFKEADLIHIFKHDSDEPFELDQENVNEIIAYINDHY